ncbi:MAG: hypothetical protein IEMM0006_1291 [bacterium]|nr:MAG: hypothetical protein IEMM0006_1291 [bacterium]
MGNERHNKIYFSEVQPFTESPVKWIYPIIFLASVAPLAYGKYQQLILAKPLGDNPASNEGLLWIFAFVFLFLVLLGIFFWKSKLEVTIDGEGIQYRFPVFIRKWRNIKKGSIARYEVRKYSPLLEYGGWGYRSMQSPRSRRNGIAYNVSGKIGLQLYFTNGRKMLLGTRRPAAMERAMKKLMDENERPYD